MYNPQKFKSDDVNEAFNLMDKNPFATLVNVVDGRPCISHLPLTPKNIGNKIELSGHLSRNNPHWKTLANSQVTVIFHGPHTYITPTWYKENDAPTWNYLIVHAVGKIELIESHEGVVECLKELSDHVERSRPSVWDFFIPKEFENGILSKSIVGFRIKVDEINFKKKLSQNRSFQDRAGVIKGLETRTDDNSRLFLSEMQQMYFQN